MNTSEIVVYDIYDNIIKVVDNFLLCHQGLNSKKTFCTGLDASKLYRYNLPQRLIKSNDFLCAYDYKGIRLAG